jgi:hypothetical protein
MAKMGLGAKVLIIGGAVAAGTVAVVASGMFRSEPADKLPLGQPTAAATTGEIETVGSSEGIDYNCNLPGNGCPWLEHMPPSKWEADPETGEVPVTVFDRVHLQGFFQATPQLPDGLPYLLWLPVAIGPDGPSMPDVYRTVCALHPDLGGSGLRPVSFEELDRLLALPEDDDGVEGGPTVATRWLTDDVTRSADEAHFAHEPIRIYSLPDLPPFVREYLTSQSCGPAAVDTTTTTGREQETQRWRVTLAGHEIDLMDRYWRLTTRVRGAVRFDYTLQGEFTLRKEDDRWVFDSGTVTYAEVGLSEEYWPEGSWEIKLPLNCTNCDQVTSGRRLTGEVFGDEVRLTWGRFRPEVKVDARIAVSCTPMPDCSEWKNRTFESSEFFQRINGQLLPLTDGAVSAPSVIDPASGLQWLDYTITVLRLDGG